MSPTRLRSCRLGALAVLLCAVLLPAAGSAQNWDAEATAGVGIPLGDLSDTHDPGFSACLSVTRWFAPRYGLRVGGALNYLGAANSLFRDATMWHYNIGPEFDLIDPTAHKPKLHMTVGLGGTTTQFEGGGDETDFTMNAGVCLEYPINDFFRIIGGPSLYLVFADDTEIVLPITAGFRYLFSTP